MPLCVGLTAVLLALWALEVWYAVSHLHWLQAFGDDLRVNTDATVRLFTGGSWYQPWQLDGPYPKGQIDILYPPVTAWFFAPFVLLGPVVFTGLGVGLLVWLVVSAKPQPWAWPLIALCLLVPTSTLKPLSGNPSLWVAVATGFAMRYRWPGALILLKPTFLPFALIGIRSRGWWITAGVLVLLSLPFLAATIAYPRVLLDAQGQSFLYSVWDWPLAIAVVLAHLELVQEPGRTRVAVAARGARARPGAAVPAGAAAHVE